VKLWRAALHLCAAAVIFVHNHPSDDPTPSQEDQEITRRLKETGDMLAIGVLDAENLLSREPVQRVVMGSKTGRSLCVWQKNEWFYSSAI